MILGTRGYEGLINPTEATVYCVEALGGIKMIK